MIPLAIVGNNKRSKIADYVDNLPVYTGQTGRFNPLSGLFCVNSWARSIFFNLSQNRNDSCLQNRTMKKKELCHGYAPILRVLFWAIQQLLDYGTQLIFMQFQDDQNLLVIHPINTVGLPRCRTILLFSWSI
jgi:hypothetical protein